MRKGYVIILMVLMMINITGSITDDKAFLLEQGIENNYIIGWTNELTILNVQSYPSVGGNWTVRFNTTGKADLTITSIDGTTWSNENENNDLKFLELRCGDEIQQYEWINNSVLIQDYECNETGYEISKVLIAGKHNLEFRFGNDTKYAYNSPGIEFDNVSLNTFSSITTASLDLGIAAGSNRMLIIATAAEANPPPNITQIDVNSNTNVGVLVGREYIDDGSNDHTVEIWRVMESDIPDGAGTVTVNVTFDGSISPGVAVMSFSGVAQQAEEAENSTSILGTQTITASITTLTDGALIVSNVGNGASGDYTSHGTGQTERWNQTPSSAVHSGTTEILATAGTDAQSHTSSDPAPNRQVMYVAAFAPAPTDTCSCPSPAGNWRVDMSDNCNVTSFCDIGGFNITFENGTSTDVFNCSATIIIDNIKINTTGVIFTDVDCYLNTT